MSIIYFKITGTLYCWRTIKYNITIPKLGVYYRANLVSLSLLHLEPALSLTMGDSSVEKSSWTDSVCYPYNYNYNFFVFKKLKIDNRKSGHRKTDNPQKAFLFVEWWQIYIFRHRKSIICSYTCSLNMCKPIIFACGFREGY